MPLRPAGGATDRLAAGRRNTDNYAELYARFPRPPTAESLASNFIDKELRAILQRNALPWTRGEAPGCARLPHAQHAPATALTATPARSAAELNKSEKIAVILGAPEKIVAPQAAAAAAAAPSRRRRMHSPVDSGRLGGLHHQDAMESEEGGRVTITGLPTGQQGRISIIVDKNTDDEEAKRALENARHAPNPLLSRFPCAQHGRAPAAQVRNRRGFFADGVVVPGAARAGAAGWSRRAPSSTTPPPCSKAAPSARKNPTPFSRRTSRGSYPFRS